MVTKEDSKISEDLTSVTSGTNNHNKKEEKNSSTHLKTCSTLDKKKPMFLDMDMMSL